MHMNTLTGYFLINRKLETGMHINYNKNNCANSLCNKSDCANALDYIS